MISVDEALERILSGLPLLDEEPVPLAGAAGRTLARDVPSSRTQPPFSASAMDGYAVRAADVENPPVELAVIGHAPAGQAFDGVVGPGQTVRIFTGAPVPDGADTIVIQENVETLDDDRINVREGAPQGKYIRPAGLDFKKDSIGLRAGTTLNARDIGLAASMNVPDLPVRRRPSIAILASGDELVPPGDTPGPNQIISSNSVALAAVVEKNGGTALDLGIAKDRKDDLRAKARQAAECDFLVTIGGASVGEHDLIEEALSAEGLTLDFWKIAMRPGKPLMFGKMGNSFVLGLPGNPVSALLCGYLFLVPAMRKMLGSSQVLHRSEQAYLGHRLRENDRRQDYLRASLTGADKDLPVATPFEIQDSSVLSGLVAADCLVIRPPFAPEAERNSIVDILRLSDF